MGTGVAAAGMRGWCGHLMLTPIFGRTLKAQPRRPSALPGERQPGEPRRYPAWAACLDGLPVRPAGMAPVGHQPPHLPCCPSCPGRPCPARPPMPDDDDLRRNPPRGLPTSEPPLAFLSTNKEGVFLTCALPVVPPMCPASLSSPPFTIWELLPDCSATGAGSIPAFPASVPRKTLTLPPSIDLGEPFPGPSELPVGEHPASRETQRQEQAGVGGFLSPGCQAPH